ncbi:MAG: tetratricopeptide repeat protein [Ktedonobacteraceae bacterium]
MVRYGNEYEGECQNLSLDPNFASAYNNKGLALDKLGRTREAQQVYNKAKQLRGET